MRGPRGQQEAEDRFDAYRQALEEHGLALDLDLIVDGDFTRESGVVAMQQLLDERAGSTARLS